MAQTSIKFHQHKDKRGNYAPVRNNPFYAEVNEGDSLSRLAHKNNVDLNKLAKLNNLTPPYNLYVGQRLKLPNPAHHVVQSDDTLYAISQSYDIDLDTLIRTNRLQRPYTIFPGQKLDMSPKSSSRNYAAAPKRSYTKVKLAPKSSASASEAATGRKLYQVKSEGLSKSARKNFSAAHSKIRPVAKSKRAASAPKKSVYHGKKVKFHWPVRGRISSHFGPKKGGLYNDGINITAKEGTAITAAADGKVVYAGNELKGYGNLLLLKHDNGFLTAYAHTQRNVVKKGDVLKRGQVIGYVGDTGHVKTPQLHFSIRRGRKAFDPEKFL